MAARISCVTNLDRTDNVCAENPPNGFISNRRYCHFLRTAAGRPDISSDGNSTGVKIGAVAFATDTGGATTPLERMGDGWQSLIRIAALDVLTQFPEQVRERVVLLFEEPETYLHPHLSRKLRGVLERLADLAADAQRLLQRDISSTQQPQN